MNIWLVIFVLCNSVVFGVMMILLNSYFIQTSIERRERVQDRREMKRRRKAGEDVREIVESARIRASDD